MSERRVKQGQGVDPEVTLLKISKTVFLLEDERAQGASAGISLRGVVAATSPFRER